MAVIPMLTPNNAVLTTATIEIATLRLDKRQVTQAVFRQVHERSPIAADGGLIAGAVSWGLVNYWWAGAERPHAEAVHLLWQLGNRLHRARLAPKHSAGLADVEDYDDEDLDCLWWHRVLATGASGPIRVSYQYGRRYATARLELFGEGVEVEPAAAEVDKLKDLLRLRARAEAFDHYDEDEDEDDDEDASPLTSYQVNELAKLEEWAAGKQEEVGKLVAAALRDLKAVHAWRQIQLAAIEVYRTKTFPMLAGLEQLYIAA